MNNIINTLNEQLQELARETVIDALIECPVQELEEALEEGKPGEYIDDLINANNSYYEAFYYFDTYYQETAGRGDAGDVCEAVRDAIDEEQGGWVYEDAEEFKNLEGLPRANWFVNLYAELMATTFLPYDYEDCIKEAIAAIAK